MKKTIRQILLVLLLAVFALGTVACADSAAKGDTNPAGTYQLISSRMNGEEQSAAEAGMAAFLTLLEDGTGNLEIMGTELPVTWDKTKKTITSGGIEDSYEYKDGVFEWTMDNVVHVFEKTEKTNDRN